MELLKKDKCLLASSVHIELDTSNSFLLRFSVSQVIMKTGEHGYVFCLHPRCVHISI